MSQPDVDVLVVGGGPAGLAAAVELKRLKTPKVLIVEREPAWGGIPRHCDHLGFGWFDLRRVLSGPGYARTRERLLGRSKAEGLLETSVLGWNAENLLSLRLTGPTGVRSVSAKAVLLATGCRERPRSARLVPGDRPRGVLTTGALQQLTLFGGKRVGERAVIVGAEHVSFSAIHTLAGRGTKVAALITDQPMHQSFPIFRVLTATLHRVPVLTRTKVTRILGKGQVEAVEVLDLPTGQSERIACDTVVFSGDWVPANELARLGGVELDVGTRGPRVDCGLRSSRPGVFAAGNVLHGAEMADVAALEGRWAARQIAEYLTKGAWPGNRGVAIQAQSPLRWIFPQSVSSEGPPRERFVLRTAQVLERATIEARQGQTLLFSCDFGRLVPNRPIELDGAWAARIDLQGAAVEVTCR